MVATIIVPMTSRKPRVQPADPQLIAAVRTVIDRLGWARASDVLGIGQHTIERLLASAPVFATTLVTARVALAAIGQEQQP